MSRKLKFLLRVQGALLRQIARAFNRELDERCASLYFQHPDAVRRARVELEQEVIMKLDEDLAPEFKDWARNRFALKLLYAVNGFEE